MWFKKMKKLLPVIIALAVLASCTGKPSESRATELIRLNYRQQSLTAGEGKWLLDSIFIDKIDKIKGDTFRIEARINGIYELPVIEDAPQGARENFHDTVEFKAWKQGKIWMAEDWLILGSSHE